MLKVKITFEDNHQETYFCSSLEVFRSGRVWLNNGDFKHVDLLSKEYKEITFSEFKDAGL